jgi:hypothetical protein
VELEGVEDLGKSKPFEFQSSHRREYALNQLDEGAGRDNLEKSRSSEDKSTRVFLLVLIGPAMDKDPNCRRENIHPAVLNENNFCPKRRPLLNKSSKQHHLSFSLLMELPV